MSTDRTTPEVIHRQLRSWYFSFCFWNIFYYAFGLAATIGALLTTPDTKNYMPEWWSPTLASLFVAASTAIIGFTKAQAKAAAYITAWRNLNSAAAAYCLDSTYAASTLADENKRGESIIAGAD